MSPSLYVRLLGIVLATSSISLLPATEAEAQDLSQGLVGYYPFSGNADDTSGNGNHGTLFGGVSLTTDRFGNPNEAYQFDGSTGYIRAVNSSAALNLTSALTLSAWVRHDSSASPQHIVNKTDIADTEVGYRLAAWWANPQGNVLELYDDAGTQHAVDDSGSDVAPSLPSVDSWEHVAGTWDGTTMKIYRDGRLEGTQSFSGVLGTAVGDLYIGVLSDPQGFFHGAIDEVRIYDRALSDAEVLAAMGPEVLTPTLYGVDGGLLSTVDPATGLLVSLTGIIEVPPDPFPIAEHGLAVNPLTNEMYIVMRFISGVGGHNRHLLRINPYTGIATLIGSMNQSIESLAFDDAGTLYAMSSDCTVGCGGPVTPETMFTVDLGDASLTPFQTLGSGDTSEAIAFNPNDGMMYHMSGQGAGLVFEKINLSTGAVTPIALSGDPILNRVTLDLVFDEQQDLFIGAVADYDFDNGTLITLSADGVLSDIGPMSLSWQNFAIFDRGTRDTDGDGIPDQGDLYPSDATEWADTDDDGVGDNADDFPYDPTETTDTDGDGFGDNSDAFPNDPTEWLDSDGDGTGDNMDVDDDNDGIPDAWDPYPTGQFDDAPPGYWAFLFIEKLGGSGITAGCGGGNYCPQDTVTRAQMAVFLERGMNGSDFSPPAATGNVFLDVAANDFAASFIEQLFNDGITSGCGGNNYCPDATVTRDQMAVFLLRAKYGSGYSPPPATGVFGDVPLGYWSGAWIEQLAAEGITAGCGGGNYCPTAPVNRDQMAVFLVRTFGL